MHPSLSRTLVGILLLVATVMTAAPVFAHPSSCRAIRHDTTLAVAPVAWAADADAGDGAVAGDQVVTLPARVASPHAPIRDLRRAPIRPRGMRHARSSVQRWAVRASADSDPL